MLQSSRYKVNYPSADRSDSADVPRDFASVVAGLEQSAMYGQGTLAARPTSTGGSPGIQGRLYMATDQSPMTLFYDYGTGWQSVGAIAAGSIGTTQLADGSVTGGPAGAGVKIAAATITHDNIVAGTIRGGGNEISAASITAADLANALKPSTGAGGGTEALRALGIGAALALTDANMGSIISQGTLASRPGQPIQAGHVYLATDTNGGTVYISTGAAWTQAAPGVTQALAPAAHAVTHKRSGTDPLVDAGSDLASAAALPVTDRFHLVTGSTTITSIAPSGWAAAKGDRVRLVFQATITVRNLNNIKLQSALDAGFVANEQLELFFDGTNWVEGSRSPRHISGESWIYNGSGTPTGSLAEDGSAISRTTYAALFNNIGTLYGAGDGSTTFNLPDKRGRMDVGYAASGGHADVSTIGNNEGITAINRRPKHRTANNLGISDPAHSHGAGSYAVGGGTPAQIAYSGGGASGPGNGSQSVTGTSLGAFTGITISGSIGTNNANDPLDSPAYLVRPSFTRI